MQGTGAGGCQDFEPAVTIGQAVRALERGTVYIVANRSGGLLSPPKVVGPWLTYWHLDGDRITYQEVICTGQAVTEPSGRVGNEQVLWDDVDTIRVGFTDADAEKDEFFELCPDAGEDVADFVVG